ncbi:MAG: DUF2878 domain-containing protein [Planctomycetes bacterium]|nr:DUF2878 domain-containing protein [Planctomycetota bacterium]
MNLLALFLVFQGAWFAIVYSGAQGNSVWAIAATAMALGLLIRMYSARGVLLRATIGASCGIVLDGTLIYFDLTTFPATCGLPFGEDVLPLWMLCLWSIFAAILPYMVPWLEGRRALGVVFGAAGGPIAYFSAEKLGAIEVAGLLGYSAVGIAWSAAMAVLPLAEHKPKASGSLRQ